jgi:hypothetical protein
MPGGFYWPGPQYFGPLWGPAVGDPGAMVETPAGELCVDCDEPIAVGDSTRNTAAAATTATKKTPQA